ncbi:hypothetical protein ACMXZU_04595 [Corynebacterium striatum]
MVEAREIGHAMPAEFGREVEDNWDLRFPRAARVYAKMIREDTQVTSVLKALTLPIRRATWRIDANGADKEIVEHVAQDLRLPVLGEDGNNPISSRTGRVSWDEHLQFALLSLPYGHMFFEQIYRVGDDGKEHLHKLAPRFPLSISKINVANDGGLESIVQYAPPGEYKDRKWFEPPVIPIERLVAYVYEPRDSTWLGSSVLRPAYKHWVLRDELLRLELNALDRNGMGVPVYTGSPFAKNPERDLENGLEIAQTMRSGDSAGASIPDGAKLEIKGTSGQLASPREAITYHDSMIAKSVLAHFLNLEGKGGSYALAETQSDLFIQSLQTIAEYIAGTATQHVVEDLVKVAYPDYDGPCPQIVFDPIASKKDLTAESLAILIDKGVIIPDKDLEEEVRRRYSLPSKRPLVETLLERAKEDERLAKKGLKRPEPTDMGGVNGNSEPR